jgi:hypothetical protein
VRRLLRLRHAVERSQHDRNDLGGCGPDRGADVAVGRHPAQRLGRAVLVDGRQAGAVATEELVQCRPLVPDRVRLEPLPLGHRALNGQDDHGARLGRVGLLRPPFEIRGRVLSHVPVPRHRHHAEVGVEAQVARRAGRHHDPAERRRWAPGPDLVQQSPAQTQALMARAHHEVRELLHDAEPHDAREADRPLAVLGDQVAALRLRIEEFDEAPVATPGLRDVGVAAPGVAHVALVDRKAIHRAIGKRERRL